MHKKNLEAVLQGLWDDRNQRVNQQEKPVNQESV